MTDQEIVCEFMEAHPATLPLDYQPWRGISPDGWWVSTPIVEMRSFWVPCDLDLDRLRLVEARLTEEQWLGYKQELLRDCCDSTFDMMRFKAAVHADAQEKIRALAAVLRPEVEGR